MQREMAMRGVLSVGRVRNPMIHGIPQFLTTRLPAASAAPAQCLVTNSYANNFQGSRYERTLVSLKTQIRALNTDTRTGREAPKKEDEQLTRDWKIKMLYDGECPLCVKEVDMLKERNKIYRTIKFVDISKDDYSPEEHQGIDYETAMGRIHAIQSDGTVVTDVDAFRRLYEEVGLGWVYAITKHEPIATIANAVYGFWAKYRMQVTGRPSLEEIFEARRKNRGEVCRDKPGNI